MKKIIKDNFVQKWLRKPFYSSKYIYLNRWSLVHFTVGFLLGLFFLNIFSLLSSALIVFLLLVLYEIFEWGIGEDLFFYERESAQDRTWDLIVGMSGFFLFWLILNFLI